MLWFDPGAARFARSRKPRRGADRSVPICAAPTPAELYGNSNAAW